MPAAQLRRLSARSWLCACMTSMLSPLSLQADTLTNAEALFNFAEATYPELLSPAAPPVQEVQGFYARYYADTDIYLGVQGDNVWVLGAQFGPQPTLVGKLDDFLQLPPTDISDATLSNRRGSCSYYADNLFSAVRDIQRNRLFNGSLDISVNASTRECVFTGNGIPNHDFNDSTAAFATAVSAVNTEFRVPLEPTFAATTTSLSLTYDNGIFLNGVKLDLLAAACHNVGDEKIGCNDINQPWRFDPMSPLTQFGTDQNNAHTQPDGAYHYHGNPRALFDQSGTTVSPVIGFAADGFPIYGTFIADNGGVRAATSSYQLRSGLRPGGSDGPGGSYDGTYVDDYQYVAGSGDLDECNGMMRNGTYGYYVTNEYPWVMACFKGTPDESFAKAGATGGMTSGGPAGGGPLSPPPGN